MTKEEKAKAYDEALERARNFYNLDELSSSRPLFQHIFPELAESEDEKIRKWLIGTIKSIPNDSLLWNDVTKNNVIAWLEKQSDNKTK